MAELDEQGKLFEAFKVKANRDKFKGGLPVDNVDLTQISDELKERLNRCSDGELAILADVNKINLERGYQFPGTAQPGIAAV